MCVVFSFIARGVVAILHECEDTGLKNWEAIG